MGLSGIEPCKIDYVMVKWVTRNDPRVGMGQEILT